MFVRQRGKTKLVWFPVTVSTAIANGALVTLSSGQVVAATSSTAAVDILGVLRHAIAAADADYAVARSVEIEIPIERNVVWKGTVTSGLVATDVGTEVDLTDSVAVNRAASSVKIVKVVQMLSATSGLFYLKQNGSY